MPAAVASRYARALADLVLQPGSPVEPQKAAAELQEFAAALAASAQLKNALLSPAVAPARKRAVVSDIVQMLGLSDLVRRFLFVLIDHRRIAMMEEVREAFETVVDERLGVVRVDVASARELTLAQREELAVELSRLTGKAARPRFTVDKALVGGVVARIGSTVYDVSVRGRLEALRARLAGAGT